MTVSQPAAAHMLTCTHIHIHHMTRTNKHVHPQHPLSLYCVCLLCIEMGPYYSYVCAQLTWPKDLDLLTSLEAANATELAECDAKIADAIATAGESEVREAMYNKANVFYRIGDKDKAIAAYESTFSKTVGSSSKIDVVFALIRLGLAFNSPALVTAEIVRAKALVEAGGDWERKNLLGVYRAVHAIQMRKLDEASTLLLDSIATFTCYELFPYNTLVFYTCLLALITVDRVTLKDKVLQSPEILAVIDDIPPLRQLIFSFYKCQYAAFFSALVDITPLIQADVYLAPHTLHYLREVRVAAYTQFLEPYRTATLQSMASSFGISPSFLEDELYKFISSGRVHARIDSVAGVVETNRPDAKLQQYEDLLKKGDALANRIQKLTKIINY